MMLSLVLYFFILELFKFVQGHHNEVEAAKIARKMVNCQSLLHFNSLTPSETPVSMIEYYISSDACDDVEGLSDNGNPILLLSQMSTSYKNWKANDTVTVTVEKHSWKPFKTPMSSPRAYFIGNLTKLELRKVDERRLAKHFVHRHPDARHWLPDDDDTHVHDTVWFEFNVESVYFVGGFGSDSYIGNISGNQYHRNFRHYDSEELEKYGFLKSLATWTKVLFTKY